MTTELPVGDIVVGDRVRKDVGDVLPLAGSIEKVGLLHPVVVNSRHELVAGARRLAACRDKLFWKTIPVRVVATLDDALAAVRAERDENTFREPLTVSEIVELGRRLEALEKPMSKRRQASTGTAPGRGRNACGKLPQASDDAGKTREKIAEALDVSPRTYEKAKLVTEAAEAMPTRFADLAEKMDADGTVDTAHRMLSGRLNKLPPVLAALVAACETLLARVGGGGKEWDDFRAAVAEARGN